MKIVHVITSTHTGGAEMMLLKLLSTLDREIYDPLVISLVSIGPIGEQIRSLGITVHCFGMRRGIPDIRVVWWLARLLRRERPGLIQTWMYHADLIGGLAAGLAGGIPVVWGIRMGTIFPEQFKRTTIWTARACAGLSRRLPARIVCCSEASRVVHTRMGYAADRMLVIPNGFDLGAFRPDPAAGPTLRRELGIPAPAPLIGLVARFHPQKDHATFFAAARRLHRTYPDAHFILCGDGISWENLELAAEADQAGLRGCCHLLGRRSDMPFIQAALDFASSSSSTGEGFPNVLGEAMACGVPCAVTDVGDSALIVGDTGRVVPSRDPEAWPEPG